MDPAMEEVIKNIIHIDKSANDLRKRMEEEVQERQQKVESEIERIRIEIVSGTREKAASEKTSQLNMATKEAENIINQGRQSATELLRKFEEKKQGLISQIFNEII